MAATFDVLELQNMKRPQLQKLCKSFGIKANRKTAQLIQDLQEYAATNFPEPKKTPTAEKEPAKTSSRKSENSGTVSEIQEVAAEGSSDCDGTEKLSTEREENKTNEYKDQVLQQLEKKVKESMPNTFECKIPRFVASGVTVPGLKSTTTPSNKWAKLHKKNFEKMDSIDVYLEKKRKRTETLYQSVKRAKKTAVDAKSAIEAVIKTPNLQSPRRKSLRKSPGVFKPTVTSLGKSATFVFESKNTLTAKADTQVPSQQQSLSKPKSLAKTTSKLPAPKIHVRIFESKRKTENWNNTCGKPKTPAVRKSVAFIPHNQENTQKTPGTMARKTTAVTPFRQFNQEPTTTPTPRKKFDLQASLAKPLGYKPHTGKLKTPPFLKKDIEPKRPSRVTEHKDIKNVKVRGRDTRRNTNFKARTARRTNAANARRGLV